ncbi:MAG: GNAT family N-acetyltransferase, partial [Betaproteobacteria bacterium]|nr:GNAT family N-acetyltransferase [Betaproteobacteria bacterium]
MRLATPEDLPAIHAIYGHHVLHGLASFEEEAPPLDELRRRFDDVRQRGLPWLAADFG